ncbi:MAG: hypothetical protein HZC22_09400 [Rhodocyclales bacterium]|nr:hypothetical protein [Rhodocyclales bacterium]
MTRLKWAVLLVGGFVVMRIAGIGPGDLWEMTSARLGKAAADTQDLASGEYGARIAATYREEVAKTKVPQPGANLGTEDQVLQTELAEARQKLLDDRAAALEKHAGALMRGDIDGLKRQVAENARTASGGI